MKLPQHLFLAAFLVSVGFFSNHTQADESNLIQNPGFEEGKGSGWQENNWAHLAAVVTQDHQDPHSGHYAERIALNKAGAGDFLLFQGPLAVKPGMILRLRFWLKGQSNAGTLDVGFRKIRPNYEDYGRLRIAPTDGWKEYVYDKVLPPSTDPLDTCLAFHFYDPMTVWIDDVSLTVLPAISDDPPLTGNQVRNGSFEVGRDGWFATFRERSSTDAFDSMEANIGADILSVPVTDAPEGKRVLRFVVNPTAKVMINSAYFPLRYGHPVDVSFWMKSDAPGKAMHLRLGGGSSPGVTWQDQDYTTADAKWNHYTFQVVPQPSSGGVYFLEFNTANPGKYELDNVSVVEDEQADGQPAATGPALQVGSDPAPGSDPANMFDLGQEANFILHVLSDKPQTLTGRVIDAWGNEIKTFAVNVPATMDGGATDIPITLPTSVYGGFKCSFTVPETAMPVAEIIYTVLPQLKPPGEVKDPFFGSHVNLTPYNLHIADRAGFRLLRLWGPLLTAWCSVEPTKGTWKFETRGLERAQKMGFRFLGIFGSPPTFEQDTDSAHAATSTWYHSWEPKDWDAWRDYITRTHEAYAPYIGEWEIWNEPNGEFLQVPVGKKQTDTYLDIVKNAAPALPPGRERISGGVPTSFKGTFTSELLDLGLARFLDSYSTHYYQMDEGTNVEENEFFSHQMERVRQEKGREGKPLDVLVTEFSIQNLASWLEEARIPDSGMAVGDAAATLVRTIVAFKALGVREAYQYSANAEPSGHIIYRHECDDFIEVNGIPRPSLAAHATVVRFLEDTQAVGLKTVPAGEATVTVASFLKDGKPIDVVWSRKPVSLGEVQGLTFSGRTGYDVMGNPIPLTADTVVSLKPIYILP